MNQYIGVDIGATKIAAGLISGQKIVKKIKVKTQAKKGKAQTVKNIKKVIAELYVSNIKGIGVGIAGQVDTNKGVVISSPNFAKNFKNVELKKILTKEFEKPVLIENDANCFVLGEALYGSAKKYDFVVGLTLGTGVGGGIVIEKNIYHGTDGFGGELGHMTITNKGLKCSCGQYGHLEAYASGTAMSKIFKQLTGKQKKALDVEIEAKNGNKQAKKVFNMMSESLATGLANIIHIFNPDAIVLGGGLAKVKILIEPTIKMTKAKLIYPELKNTKIIATKLKGDAPILGAASLLKNNKKR